MKRTLSIIMALVILLGTIIPVYAADYVTVKITATNEAGSPLSGVTFALFHVFESTQPLEYVTTGEDGTVVCQLSSQTYNGNYYWQAVTPPESYAPNEHWHIFALGASAPSYTEVDVVFEPIAAKFRIIKTNEKGQAFPGVTYNIYKDSSFVESVTTNVAGNVTTSRLPYGTYEIVEVTPDGYVDNAPVFGSVLDSLPIEIQFSSRLIQGSVNIVASNAVSGNITDAEISIYKSNGAWIADLTTDGGGTAFYGGLNKDSYYAVVRSVPDGYANDMTQHSFSISYDGQIETLNIGIERAYGNVRVIKTDNYGFPIAGVRYGIYDSQNGFIDEIITGTDGTATSRMLNHGNYELRELSTVDGYTPMTEAIPFAIYENGVTVEIPISGTLITGSVRVLKTDEDGIPIPGVKFDLYNSADQKIDELITSIDGTAISGSHVKGNYYLLETEAAEGYIPNEEPIHFSITTHNEIIQKTVVNSWGHGHLVLTVSSAYGVLSGVSFDVFRVVDDEMVGTITTEADGTATTKLPIGHYYLNQTHTKPDHILPENRFHFSLTSHGMIHEMAVQNEVIPLPQTGYIRAIKLMIGTGTLLQDAVFGVYDADTNVQVDTLTTGNDGTAISAELPAGEYYLRELAAPQGFIPITANIDVTVTVGNTIDMYIYNSPIPANGYIRLTKLEEGTNKPLQNVVFGIYDAYDDTKVAELTTGADGTAVSGELSAGDYYLMELQGLDGYEVVTDKTGIAVMSGETSEITIYNALLPTTGYIRLIMKAEGTDEPLQNAVFGVYTASGNSKVAELTTDAQGKAITGELLAGDYYLLEQTAPIGFTPITDKIGASVTAGETSVITVYNTPLPTTGRIQFIKKAEGTDAPLQNAVFGVYTASGDSKVAELTTDAEGKAITDELLAGDYYLLEQTAPIGFIPITSKIGVTVKAGETAVVTVYNAPLPTTGRIQLTKKAEGTGTLLKDTVFGVYSVSNDTKVAEMTTDIEGKATSGELTAGDYYLLEQTAPVGYIPLTEKINITVNAGEVTEKTVYNVPLPVEPPLTTGYIRLIKKAEGTDAPLKDAVFGVYTVSGDIKVAELITDADGKAITDELPAGYYYLLEHIAPNGFTPITDKIGVTVKSGETAVVTVYNALSPDPLPITGSIQLTKKAEGTGALLKDAIFGVYTATGDIKVAELVTDVNGKAVSGELTVGDYYLLEQTAPVGYTLITDKIGITVKAGEITEKTVYNVPLSVEPPLPTSGFIRLIKKAEGTDAPLKDAVFGIYTVSGDVKIAELKTDASGKAISGELPAGNYYLLEQTAPVGYTPLTDKIGVTVKAGETGVVTVYNSLLPTPLPTTGRIQLIKKAEGTGTLLKDAIFGVFTVTGDVKVAELKTDKNGKGISGELPAGDYYLLEQTAPVGYTPLTDKIGITVIAGQTVDKTIFNAPVAEVSKTGQIRLIKRAEVTGQLLSNAVFSVYEATQNKKVAELITGADGTAMSAALPEGAYYLVEKQAPTGFVVNPTPVYFYLKAGEVKEMALTNAKEEVAEVANSYVLLVKVAEGTGTRLHGAIFGLYKQGSDEKIAELVTGSDGTAMSAAILAGDYYILELTAPTGYKLKSDKVNFHANANETTQLVVYNTPLDVNAVPTGNLHLTKKAEISGEQLPGAIFGVYDAITKVKVSEITTGADGTAICELPEGSYYLLESKAPAGFALEPAQIPFYIAVDNTVKVEVTNMAEKGGVSITAKDVNGSPLVNAVFGVYDAYGRKVAELTTGKDGKAMYDVPAGVYYLLEQELPNGYTVGNDRYSLYVTAGQNSDVLILKQKSGTLPPFEIPKTGEAFPWLNYCVAALCLLMAVALCLNTARTRRYK